MKKIYLMLMLMIGLSCLALADTIKINLDRSVSIVPAAPLVDPLFRIDGLLSGKEVGGAIEAKIYHGFTLGGYYLLSISGVNVGYGGKTFAMKCGGEKLKEQKKLSFSLAGRFRLAKKMEVEASYSTKNTVGLTLRYLFGKSLGVGLGYLYIPKPEKSETARQTTIAPGNEMGDTTQPPLPPVEPPPPPPPN